MNLSARSVAISARYPSELLGPEAFSLVWHCPLWQFVGLSHHFPAVRNYGSFSLCIYRIYLQISAKQFSFTAFQLHPVEYLLIRVALSSPCIIPYSAIAEAQRILSMNLSARSVAIKFLQSNSPLQLFNFIQ